MDEKISLPTHEQILEFWSTYRTPQHIQDHMKQVNRVAVHIAEQLKQAGERVIIEVVDRAALLHDTIRVTDWKNLSFDYFTSPPSEEDIAMWEEQRATYPQEIPHAQVNYEIYKDQFPEIARVILHHDIISTPELQTWEEKVVNYADRRVMHTTIVTVQQRLEDGFARYKKMHGSSIKKDPKLIQAIYDLENEIYSVIGGNPEKLSESLKHYEQNNQSQKEENQADEST